MVIAEALNARKDCYQKAKSLAGQIGTEAVVEKKDPDRTVAQIDALTEQLEQALIDASELTVRINRANNREVVTFESYSMSLMQAIALRDQLTLEHQLRSGILDAVDQALGKTSGRYGRLYGRKTKDDVKEVSLIDRDEYRKATDKLAERRRLLDIEIQKVNWSAEL